MSRNFKDRLDRSIQEKLSKSRNISGFRGEPEDQSKQEDESKKNEESLSEGDKDTIKPPDAGNKDHEETQNIHGSNEDGSIEKDAEEHEEESSKTQVPVSVGDHKDETQLHDKEDKEKDDSEKTGEKELDEQSGSSPTTQTSSQVSQAKPIDKGELGDEPSIKEDTANESHDEKGGKGEISDNGDHTSIDSKSDGGDIEENVGKDDGDASSDQNQSDTHEKDDKGEQKGDTDLDSQSNTQHQVGSTHDEGSVSNVTVSTPPRPSGRISLCMLALRDNICDIPNTLLLDGEGKFYRIIEPYQSLLNGVPYNPIMGREGVLVSINAVHFDKLLEIDIVTGDSDNYVDECIGTPYGFKLSTILDNIDVDSRLKPSAPKTEEAKIPSGNGWTNMAHLFMVQRAFSVERCGEKYLLFVFEIKNVGEFLAQKVLFKDVIPHGLNLCYPGIYYKYNDHDVDRFDQDNYDVFGREIFIRLNNLEVGDTVTLIILTRVNNKDYKNEINIGVISYVAYQIYAPNAKVSIVDSEKYTYTRNTNLLSESYKPEQSYQQTNSAPPGMPQVPQKKPVKKPLTNPITSVSNTLIIQSLSNPKSLFKKLK